MISDERLKQLIEYQNKWCAECELDDTDLPGIGLWDTHNALAELAQYRRTFAKIEEMLKEGAMHVGFHGKHDGGAFETVLFHYGVADSRQFGDTPFAALSALADSIIREELERKGPPHHEQ